MIYFLSKKKLLFKLSNEVTEISNVEEVLSNLSNETEICLDTETTGINPHEDVIIMLQLGTVTGDQYVIDTRDFPIEHFKNFIESRELIVGHNLKFDYNMLKRYGVLLNNIYDTMLADQVLYNGKYSMQDIIKNKRYSLAGVYRFYYKKNIDKEVREEFHTISDSAFTLRQVTYGANDVKYPLLIKKKQLKEIEEWQLTKCVNLENKVSLALGDIEYNGFYLNSEKWNKITDIYKERIKTTVKKLDTLVLNQGYKSLKYKKIGFQLDLFTGDIVEDRLTTINWSSDQQVYEILTSIFNLNPVDKHGKASSGAKAIELMTEKHDILDLILQYREEDKVISSFGEKFVKKYLDKDNRLHTTYNQIIETGRVSSRKPKKLGLYVVICT
jgi:DNA polymerase-1